MAEHKPYLDVLFENADALMQELSAAEGYFTNYAFIRRAAQRNQGAYVGLLNEILRDRGEQYLFNLAHQAIGGRLRNEAEKAGYTVDKGSGIQEVNIWGDETDCVVYRLP